MCLLHMTIVLRPGYTLAQIFYFVPGVTDTYKVSSNPEKMTGTSDQHVIEQILQGDRLAYALVVDRYKNLVFTLALRMLKNREEAEEVAQDTFVKMFKSLAKFKGNSKFSTWIYKIAYNTCLDNLKRNKKKMVADNIDEIAEYKTGSHNNTFEILEAKEQQQIVQRCLQMLPGDESFLLTLYYFEDLSLDEIAAIAGIKANNVKIKLYRSRKKLAALLKPFLETEITETYEKAH